MRGATAQIVPRSGYDKRNVTKNQPITMLILLSESLATMTVIHPVHRLIIWFTTTCSLAIVFDTLSSKSWNSESDATPKLQTAGCTMRRVWMNWARRVDQLLVRQQSFQSSWTMCETHDDSHFFDISTVKTARDIPKSKTRKPGALLRSRDLGKLVSSLLV